VKVLVLGATGMLGHKLMQIFDERFDAQGTVRGSAPIYRNHPVLGGLSLHSYVQAENFDSIIEVIAIVKPDVVVNCIGIIKQHPNAKDPLRSIALNSFFPHRLARLCQASRARMIHISTDCVFSGKKGNYSEDDFADPVDLYGQSKLLGEVKYPGCLTLRTSMIGRELKGRFGLIEWFLGQKGKRVRGFAGAIYTGFTTLALANLIGDIIDNNPELSGLWHVSSDPISKYDLLSLVNQEFELGAEIERDQIFNSDRSLNSARFRIATGFKPPAWESMINQLASDVTAYDRLV
jgi:dTDP-4-dehydrorhamnose reductase